MVSVKGLEFETSFNHSIIFEDEDLQIRTINRNDLLRAKKMAGRAKDVNDIENLPAADS